VTPFVLAPYRDLERLRRTRDEIVAKLRGDLKEAQRLLGAAVVDEADIFSVVTRLLEEQAGKPIYLNDVYQVIVEDVEVMSLNWPDTAMVHLSIRRLDREIVRDWRDIQEIKNQLVGPECEGFELFPAESRLVDAANQYHLFVFKNPAIRIPLGFKDRCVGDQSLSTTKQRKREHT
jgi:hypothetical protein